MGAARATWPRDLEREGHAGFKMAASSGSMRCAAATTPRSVPDHIALEAPRLDALVRIARFHEFRVQTISSECQRAPLRRGDVLCTGTRVHGDQGARWARSISRGPSWCQAVRRATRRERAWWPRCAGPTSRTAIWSRSADRTGLDRRRATALPPSDRCQTGGHELSRAAGVRRCDEDRVPSLSVHRALRSRPPASRRTGQSMPSKMYMRVLAAFARRARAAVYSSPW